MLELKSVQEVLPIHKAQLLSYMKLLDIPIGLLINFHELKLVDGSYCRNHCPAVRQPVQGATERLGLDAELQKARDGFAPSLARLNQK